MASRTVHFAEYAVPSFLFASTWTKQIDARDPESALPMPENAVGFRLFDRKESEEESGMVLRSEPFNHSGWHWRGDVKTYEQVLAEKPGSVLESNMRCNDYSRVVVVAGGAAFPLRDEDVVL